MAQTDAREIIGSLESRLATTAVLIEKQFAGFQQTLFVLRLTEGERVVRCFLKAFGSNASWWTANADSIFDREVRAIELLGSSGLSTPRILHLGVHGQVRWLLMPDIGGTCFARKTPNFDAEDLGRFVARLHGVSPADAGAGLTCADELYIDTRIREMASMAGLSQSAVNAMVRIASWFAQTSDLVFCHGDLNLGNLIVLPDHDFGLLDFEESVIGYRQYDVAQLALGLTSAYGEGCARCFLNSYSAATGLCLPSNLLEEWLDFTTMRDRIVGLFLQTPEATKGLPFSRGFVTDNRKAVEELRQILTRRARAGAPGRD